MKKTVSCLLLVLIVFAGAFSVSASVEYPIDVPFESYVYNSSDEPMKIPAPFSAERTVLGENISGKSFDNLSDVFYNNAGKIFLCDTGNGRVIALDTEFNFLYEISEFEYSGERQSLNEPQGVWADSSRLYISDTGNGRIAVFDINGGAAVNIFEKPEIAALGDNYEYKPTKLSVDTTGKIYVVAAGINQGLICLDENGEFQSFLGAPKVEPDFFEIIWRKLATKEQLAKMDSYVPTEYNSVAADSNGFLYVTSQTSNTVPAAKLNNNGDDVMTEPKSGFFGDTGYLKGTDKSYKPYFTDICLCISEKLGGDIFYILDSKQGKIYAYNEEGYMLYAFGANGVQQGTYYAASAIEYVPQTGGGMLLVADSFKGTLTVLRETDFSAKVKKALELYGGGYYDDARTLWQEVSETASGYVLAKVSLARIDMRNKDYAPAMKSLMEIREHSLYSQAFSSWRDDFLRDHFGAVVVILLVAVSVIIVGVRLFRRSRIAARLSENSLYTGYRYGSYVMIHPFDGFWDLKHEKRGNMRSAALIAVLFFLIYALRLQFGGYVVTGTVNEDVNVIYGVMMVLLPLVFWVLANWCFTTLMDGKGNMRDIVIATCYVLKPYVIFGIPMLLLSNVLTVSEVVFYNFFDTVILVWILFLLFSSLISTHEYTFGKALLTLALILIGMCLIIFIILLVISIIQNVYQFGFNIYQELSFRSY